MKRKLVLIKLCLAVSICTTACGNSAETSSSNVEIETETQETQTQETQTQKTETQDTETLSVEEATDLDSTLNESDGVEIVEVLDTAMYVVKAGNLRTGDGTNFNLMDTLVVNAELHVTGKTANGWYEVTWGDGKGYAPAECLSTEKPAGLVTQEDVTDSPISDELQEEVNRLLEEMDSQYDETDNGSGGGLFFEDNPDWEKDQSKIQF